MRQFLAIVPPPPARARLESLVAELRRRPAARGWRFVPGEAIHLTLRFLGEVSDEQDAGAREGWRAAARGVPSFELETRGIGAFPTARRPRVLVVPVVEQADLTALAGAVEAHAREAGFEGESRAFRPHLTLARAPRGARLRVPGGAPPAGIAFAVDRISLVRSDLTPAGARYTVVETYPMGGYGLSRDSSVPTEQP